MTLTQKIKNFYERTFRDEIVTVEPPREWWIEYRDIGRRLEGYIVPVVYKYRGKRNLCATIDNDHLNFISKEKALQNAMTFYNNAIKKIKARNENSK